MSDGHKPILSRRTLLEGAALAGALLASNAAAIGAALPASDGGDAFLLISGGQPAAVLTDTAADPAVRSVADSFAQDLQRISGKPASRISRIEGVTGSVVLIGVLGRCALIDSLVAAGRIKPTDIAGAWEAFSQIVVDQPFPGVARALVIVGSDRRGAIFGTYDISERIGVSPWHWFADVPVRRRTDIHIPAGSRSDRPKVRYRGFFINDEDPCFSGWAIKRFGGINAALYKHVFELLLRMKGNYLWPAMWAPKAFAADDPRNQILADEMGVIMGSSHHEVMMRAQDEWHRDTGKGVTGGPWDYGTNGKNLRTFWRGGIERMMSKGDGRGYESVVTIGMRGDGDEAMAEGTATALLERIVADQRLIIAEVTKRPPTETPQVWALYKEVQDYYDHGMKVPDDVTLLFSDDNWGQIRRLPYSGAPDRRGGYGVYYHLDYVGAPRNYKWINTNQIEKIWQQMDLAYARGARAMWIVNVGDIKPMEFPLGFFMAMAWDPEAMTPTKLASYPRTWAEATFGPDHTGPIGDMMTRYSGFAARRKPELIDQDSFALGPIAADVLDGGEFGAMITQWDILEARMLSTRARLGAELRDAYYQLIEFPIAALANLYRLYYAAAWNKALASRNDPRANFFADQVEASFARDGELTARYHAMANRKWDGMMNQVHMSYVIWNDPTQQSMPSITRVGGDTPADRRGQKPRFLAPARSSDGAISIEAAAFSRARDGAGLHWTAIPNLGRSEGAMLALPQGRPPTSQSDAVCLEYDVNLTTAGPRALTLHMAPTLDTIGRAGVRIGISIDGGAMQTLVSDLEATGGAQDTPGKKRWADAVSNNIVRLSADLGPLDAGRHVVKIWRIDDNAVLERLVLGVAGTAAG